jgi:hypothetical protein
MEKEHFATSAEAMQCKEQWNCDYCGLVFATERELVAHLAVHEAVEETQPPDSTSEHFAPSAEAMWYCGYCGRGFATERELARHWMTAHEAAGETQPPDRDICTCGMWQGMCRACGGGQERGLGIGVLRYTLVEDMYN